MKRLLARLTAICLLVMMCFAAACSDDAALPSEAEGSPMPENTPGEAQSTVEPVQTAAPRKEGVLIGYVIEDDGQMSTFMSMHGFLRTAENTATPAKLYRATCGDEAVAAVEQAHEDGVTALMIMDPDGRNDAAVKRAVELGIPVVTTYYRCSVEGIAANVYADDVEFYEDLASGISNRMTERSLKTGRILVYGRDTAAALEYISAALTSYNPQFTAVAFNRTARDEEAAIQELAEFILENRDIKGMYVVDTDMGSIAIKGRQRAISLFKNYSPTPTPRLTPTPDGFVPSPTPNPSLLKQILITVFCSGLSDDNFALFNDNDIYALCIEPYYEAAAQGTIMLQLLSGGGSVAEITRVNRPIVYQDTVDKYKAIYGQVKDYFAVSAPENGDSAG